MPPLTSVRAYADKVAGAPTIGRTQATRVRTRGSPPARQVTGWPELLTELTCWWYTGDFYQVSIESAAAGHALVGIRGPTQASIEYMRGALELIASLMGMVQRREPLFSLYDIKIISSIFHSKRQISTDTLTLTLTLTFQLKTSQTALIRCIDTPHLTHCTRILHSHTVSDLCIYSFCTLCLHLIRIL